MHTKHVAVVGMIRNSSLKFTFLLLNYNDNICDCLLFSSNYIMVDFTWNIKMFFFSELLRSLFVGIDFSNDFIKDNVIQI